MNLRKLIAFNTAIGITIPPEYCEALQLKAGEYVSIYLGANKTILIKKQEIKDHKPTINNH